MSIIFDPTEMAKKAAPKAKIKRMISRNFTVKRSVLAQLGGDGLPIKKKQVQDVALKTLKAYKERIAREVVQNNFERSAGEALKKELIKNPKQLIQRVQREIIFQVHTEIKAKYKGERARWLPSDAEEPRPEHQLHYGKVYIIGEGIDGVEPGDEYGCKCGVEILTDETELDLS
jgi:hypothetical protein